ncbi:MAG: aldehyde ferredoxin oxidoreductase [Deltaproteobacteria bacterium]|nr:aldehyde ferredoxin oxidoreductase [Deltaproteobacteria bacterium]
MSDSTSAFGWCGRRLNVDLDTGRLTVEPLPVDLLRAFLGGRGLNSLVLFERVRPGIDPLSPDNVVCFGAGPLSGTSLPMTSRMEVSTLSPYSGILGDGNAGEKMAHAMKTAGFDQFVIQGASAEPVYLLVRDGQASIEPASDIWGLSTWEATDILKERHGRAVSVAAIGQAGENLVRMASTIVDKYASAARGSGAVLGSKRLKAVVVDGTRRVDLAEPEVFAALAEEDRRFFREDPTQREVAAKYGSHHGVTHWYPGWRNHEKILKAEEIPAALHPEGWKKYEVKRTGCFNCPVRCKNLYEIPSGRRAGERGAALEYECIYCLGTNCGVLDPVVILEMENLCDAYGLDVLALGNTVALAKDLFARDLIGLEDTGGLDLSWDAADDQVELIHQTALRHGFGNLVAEGMYGLAKIVGGRAMDYCYHVKGLSRGPFPAGIFALAHATSTRGADHLRGRSWAFGENDPQVFPALVQSGKLPADMETNPVSAVVVAERVCTLADAIGRCKGAVNAWSCALPLVWKHPLYDGLCRLLTAATGQDFTPAELETAADRIYMLERAFNCRQGAGRIDDRLTMRPEDMTDGRWEVENAKHQAMLNEYYAVHAIDPETARPTAERLRELGLDFAVPDMETVRPPWDGPPLWKAEDYPRGGQRV